MPSDTETLGFVVLEAMASGLPVVGVAAGGVVDIIEPGKNGFLAINLEDMRQFTKHVTTLIENPALRQQMGQQAAEWAQGWSWEAATSRLRNIQYKKAIALHRGRDERGRHIPDLEEAIISSDYEI